MGSVLSGLARMVARNEGPVGGDSASLAARAGDAYERATQVDAEYLRAWAWLAYLLGWQRDVEAARSLVKQAGRYWKRITETVLSSAR